MIVVRVKEKVSGDAWMLIGVYGDPNRVGNPEIWGKLETFIIDCDDPICVVGDFNAISAASEKWGGAESFSALNRAFRNWIHGVGLIDLGYHGPAYTWSNKKIGTANVSERLDRGLGNLSWMMKFPDTSVFHLPRFQSDHLPILVRTKPVARKSKPPFKCENWWGLRDDFKEVYARVVQEGGQDWNRFSKGFKRKV